MWPFKKTNPPVIPTRKTDYPYGTFIVTEAGYFLVRDRGRYKIPTDRIMKSWNSYLCPSSEVAVKHLATLGNIGFRDGTLIRDESNKKDYLISKNKKRHIVSPDVYRNLCLDENRRIRVSSDEANLHEDGEVLN